MTVRADLLNPWQPGWKFPGFGTHVLPWTSHLMPAYQTLHMGSSQLCQAPTTTINPLDSTKDLICRLYVKKQKSSGAGGFYGFCVGSLETGWVLESSFVCSFLVFTMTIVKTSVTHILLKCRVISHLVLRAVWVSKNLVAC